MVSNATHLKKYDVLCEQLKYQYWSAFKAGSTWNYFICREKYVETDSWSTLPQWKAVAEECLESGKNVLQALEVLLALDFDSYFAIADDLVSSWYKNGMHDSYYYFDILAMFPKEHKIRKSIFNIADFDELILKDDWGQNALARSALLRAEDSEFLEYLGFWLNSSIESESENEIIEEDIIPLLVEFGGYSKNHISQKNIESMKSFVKYYLEKDEKFVNFSLNGGDASSYDRTLWIADNVGYWSWALGWCDVIDLLKKSEWYWLAMFSELWDDADNNNLVIWAMLHSDSIIRSRAIDVMSKDNAESIDGAIAWERLKKQHS